MHSPLRSSPQPQLLPLPIRLRLRLRRHWPLPPNHAEAGLAQDAPNDPLAKRCAGVTRSFSSQGGGRGGGKGISNTEER